jgi:hypothetical protein
VIWRRERLKRDTRKFGRASDRCADSRRRSLHHGTAWPRVVPFHTKADVCSRNHDTIAAVSLG